MLRIRGKTSFFFSTPRVNVYINTPGGVKYGVYLCVRGLAKIHTPVFNVGMEYPLRVVPFLFKICKV